eukprot:jgi/Mesen1/853/ME000112S10996
MTILSLKTLCTIVLIDNVDLLGDVGDTHEDFLRPILLHCNAEQLARIEDATEGRDLTVVTDDMWKACYARRYGAQSAAQLVERMTRRSVVFPWRTLYEEKGREQEETQKRCVNRLRQLYNRADAEKQSRQLVVCKKLPPESRKRARPPSQSHGRNGWSTAAGCSSSVSGERGRLMKKARTAYAHSNEARAYASIKNRPHTYSPPRQPARPLALPPKAATGAARPPSSKPLLAPSTPKEAHLRPTSSPRAGDRRPHVAATAAPLSRSCAGDAALCGPHSHGAVAGGRGGKGAEESVPGGRLSTAVMGTSRARSTLVQPRREIGSV